MELRPEDIEEILRVFAESELEELHLEVDGTRLDVSKSAGQGRAGWDGGGRTPAPPSAPSGAAPATNIDAGPGLAAGRADGAADARQPSPDPADGASAEASAAGSAASDGLVELRSPLLGVFYRRPAPDQPPFVEVGSEVGPDDPICIIDVMKMYTRVPAGTAGTVVDILAQDGDLVEHGQVLTRIRPR